MQTDIFFYKTSNFDNLFKLDHVKNWLSSLNLKPPQFIPKRYTYTPFCKQLRVGKD